MKQTRNRILALLTALFITASAVPSHAADEPLDNTDEVRTSHSTSITESATLGTSSIPVLGDNGQSFNERKAEITQRWKELKPRFSGSNYYDSTPSTRSPYRAGTVKEAYLEDALNLLNFYRFLAGLPDDVDLKEDYIEKSQHGTVLNAASGSGHFPSQPGDMPSDFYRLAYAGTSNSNLYPGKYDLISSVHGWLQDPGNSNMNSMGHRRWSLNPQMQYTGFGLAGGHAAMYATDSSRRETVDYGAICYPSGAAFPNDIFKGDYVWSISINPALYQTPSMNEVSVKLTQKSNGKSWIMAKGRSGHFNISTQGYGGINNAIVFRPNGISSYSGAYNVEVTGLKDKQGNPVELSYDVTFFSMGSGLGTGGSSGGGSGSGSGGGSGSGSGGGGVSGSQAGGTVATGSTSAAAVTASTSSNVETSGTVSASKIKSELEKALAAVKAGGKASVTVRNAKTITPTTLRNLADTAAAAGKTAVLYADTTTASGSIQGRLYVEPAKLKTRTTDLKLGIYTDTAKVSSVKSLFQKYYRNQIAIVNLEHQGSFGARLQLAVHVDLSNMNTKNLVFYSYNKNTNKYTMITDPQYFIDSNGYLHFYAEQAGDIIISDGVFAKK